MENLVKQEEQEQEKSLRITSGHKTFGRRTPEKNRKCTSSFESKNIGKLRWKFCQVDKMRVCG